KGSPPARRTRLALSPRSGANPLPHARSAPRSSDSRRRAARSPTLTRLPNGARRSARNAQDLSPCLESSLGASRLGPARTIFLSRRIFHIDYLVVLTDKRNRRVCSRRKT